MRILNIFVASVGIASAMLLGCPATSNAVTPQIKYQTARVDDLDIFYREAGPKGAPVVLLLHGFPSSSHMFRNLIPALATRLITFQR